MSASTDRCPTCDRRKPTADDVEHALACKSVQCTDGADACWGDGQCESNMVDWRQRALDAEAEIKRGWEALRVDPKEAQEDPDTATLSQSISVSLQYERDKSEMAWSAIRSAESERDAAIAKAERFEQAYMTARREIDGESVTVEDITGEPIADVIRSLKAERDAARARAEQAEASCASMRKALHTHYVWMSVQEKHGGPYYSVCNSCAARGDDEQEPPHSPECALASNAGASLLAEVEALRRLERIVRATRCCDGFEAQQTAEAEDALAAVALARGPR